MHDGVTCDPIQGQGYVTLKVQKLEIEELEIIRYRYSTRSSATAEKQRVSCACLDCLPIGWLTDRAMHRTPHNRRGCIIFTARCTLVQSAVLRSHVVCPSVRLSVTLVDQDHIGRKSFKLIARTLSPTPSLFVAKRPPTYSKGNMGKF